MSDRELCRCGRPKIARSGDLEPTCAECRAGEDFCDCQVVLPPLPLVAEHLTAIPDELSRRRRTHEIIRDLAACGTEIQQAYRDAIVGVGFIGRGDWKEALSEAKKVLRAEPQNNPNKPADNEPAAVPQRDALDITEEPEAVRIITEAINNGHFSEVYVRGDQLVQVSSGEDCVIARDVDDAILRRLIADNLTCVRRTQIGIVGALPMPITCRAILALQQWPKVRRLRGVATFPVPLPDGTILQESGYDAGSGLYLRESLGVTAVPDRPTNKDVAAARQFMLGRFLADFPWTSKADSANALAMLLTPLMRELVDDVFPFPYITAPERGSGKTLLAALLKILYGGSMRTLPRKEEEVEKTITSALRGASPVIIFDNVPQDTTIKSPALAAVLTMRHWTSRIMGGHRDGTWPNDRLWVATGTNIALGGDFAQRSMRIAMDYGKPNPDQRKSFKIPEIERWTAAHRGEVLWHLLVLVRSWQLGGAPRDKSQVMRGYTPWAQILGGLLAFHEVDGFLANRDEVVGQDEEGAEMAAFLKALKDAYGSNGRTCRNILDDATVNRQLEDALPATLDGGKHTPRSLGKLLSGYEGKWYGKPQLTLRRRQDGSSISWWRVEEYQDPA